MAPRTSAPRTPELNTAHDLVVSCERVVVTSELARALDGDELGDRATSSRLT